MDDKKFEAICLELEETHHGLLHLCKKQGFKSRRPFHNYLEKDKEYMNRYVRAREKQLDYLEELLREEAFNDTDDEKPFVGVNHIQRDRLKIDTLKFILGKLRARKWGDKIDVTSDGEKIEGINVTIVKPEE